MAHPHHGVHVAAGVEVCLQLHPLGLGGSHKIVEDALFILENLEHRGAVGADPLSGDGAGILIQIPHAFLAAECASLSIRLPAPGDSLAATALIDTDST